MVLVGFFLRLCLIIVIFLIGFWFTQRVGGCLTQKFAPLSHGSISVWKWWFRKFFFMTKSWFRWKFHLKVLPLICPFIFFWYGQANWIGYLHCHLVNFIQWLFRQCAMHTNLPFPHTELKETGIAFQGLRTLFHSTVHMYSMWPGNKSQNIRE